MATHQQTTKHFSDAVSASPYNQILGADAKQGDNNELRFRKQQQPQQQPQQSSQSLQSQPVLTQDSQGTSASMQASNESEDGTIYWDSPYPISDQLPNASSTPTSVTYDNFDAPIEDPSILLPKSPVRKNLSQLGSNIPDEDILVSTLIDDPSLTIKDSLKKVSLTTAYISLVKGNVGPGCLALPCVFGDNQTAGLVTAFGILVWVSLISLYVPKLLLETQENLRRSGKKADTYEQLAYQSLGRGGEQVARITLCVLQLGICTVFLNYMGDSIVVGFGITQYLKFTYCVFIVGGCALLISLGRSVQAFAIFTKLATFAMVVALLMIFTFTIEHAVNYWDPTGERVRNLQYFPPSTHAARNFALTFGNLAYTSATGVGLILPIAKDIALEDRKHYLMTTRKALFTAMIVFALLGVGCSIVFAGPEDENTFCLAANAKSITAELRVMQPAVAPDWVLAAMNGILVVAVLLTYPLQLHPAVEVMESCLGIVPAEDVPIVVLPDLSVNASQDDDSGVVSEKTPLVRGDGASNNSKAGNNTNYKERRRKIWNAVSWRLLRVVLVTLTACCAAFIAQLTDIISLVGCLTSGVLGMMLPVIMDIQVRRSMKLPISWFRILFGAFSFISGVFAITLGNMFTVIELIYPDNTTIASNATETSAF